MVPRPPSAPPAPAGSAARRVSARLSDFPWDRLTPYRDQATQHSDGLADLSVGTPVDPTPDVVQQALRDSAPIIAHGRPYTVDLFGWFDDFSHTGASDALGSFSRVQTYVNAFSVQNGLPTNLIPLADRTNAFRSMARLRQVKRCPGGAEEAAADGSNVLSPAEQADLDCREGDRATGNLP